MLQFHQYCTILEVSENASLDEIIKAYRQKAKLYHPDVNPHPKAHAQFVLLNEAFVFLKKYHAQPTTKSAQQTYWHEWQQEKQHANEQARKQAEMRYRDYIQSDEYRYLNALNIIVDHLGIVLSMILPIALPTLFFWWLGKKAWLICLIFLTMLIPYMLEGWRIRSKFNHTQFFEAIKFSFRFYDFQLVFLTIFNVLLFWNFCLPTMIYMRYILLLFGLSILICFLLWQFYFRAKIKSHWSMIVFGIAPLICNLLFVSNSIFSFNLHEEKYHFRIADKTTEILLKDGAYADFTYIRFFIEPEKLVHYSTVNYEFATGIYGWKVMKKCSFE